MFASVNVWLAAFGSALMTTVVPVALILLVGIVIIRLAMRLLNAFLEKSKLEPAAHKLIRTVVKVVLYGLLALIAAEKLGIDVTGVVALASVLTLALSLSVQNALTNLISGFTLLYTDPFSAGDFVEIAGQSGTVQEIGLAYTKLATPDNKQVFIPNSSVTSAEIVNYTVLGKRRMEFAVSASYDANVEQVLEALKAAAQIEGVREEEGVFAGVTGYGDSAIQYVLRCWANNDVYWDVYFAIQKGIKDQFDQKGIEMTYPHLNVHLDK